MGYYVSMAKCEFHVKAENFSKVVDHLDKFQFVPEIDSNSNIIGLEFTGEKLWDQREMFEQIAQFVEDGSYIEMHGEDESMWRWVFKNGVCHEIDAIVTWPEVF